MTLIVKSSRTLSRSKSIVFVAITIKWRTWHFNVKILLLLCLWSFFWRRGWKRTGHDRLEIRHTTLRTLNKILNRSNIIKTTLLTSVYINIRSIPKVTSLLFLTWLYVVARSSRVEKVGVWASQRNRAQSASSVWRVNTRCLAFSCFVSCNMVCCGLLSTSVTLLSCECCSARVLRQLFFWFKRFSRKILFKNHRWRNDTRCSRTAGGDELVDETCLDTNRRHGMKTIWSSCTIVSIPIVVWVCIK